jgi:hypothetical protein
MKFKGCLPVQTLATVCFSLFIFISSCRLTPASTDTLISENENNDGRNDDITGAAAYELNMLKDPATGKIPDGIREKELAQAQDIYQKQSLINNPLLSNAYSFEGPNNLGGRTRTIAYDVRYNGSSNQIILAGGISGGVYKSIDNGATWVRKSPTGQHFSVTSIAQDPRTGHEDTWYYSTGESLGNSTGAAGAFYTGNGIYKSTDNGESWTRLANSNPTPLESFSTPEDLISKVAVNPVNGDVYMACVSAIKRSQDGGTTWSTVLSGTLTNSTQMTDIVITSTGGRLYAAFAGTNSIGADGVWTSTTGNSASWTRIAGPGGTPVGWNANAAYGRVVLAIAPSNENLVYALYWNNVTNTCPATSPEAELFLWDQSITTWVDRSANLPDEAGCSIGNDPFAAQGGYDLVVTVKPDDANTVFIGGSNIYRSTDGFATTGNTTRIGGYASSAGYALYTNSHSDIHAIVFQPGSTVTMLCGDDGGIQRTTNNLAATVAWTQINSGYKTYQYYYVALDPRSGNNKVMGGAQDNGTTRNIGGTGTSFENAFGGDGVSVGLSDLIAGNTFEYCGTQSGFIYRRNSTTSLGSATDITPTGKGNSGLFVTLFYLDPDNTQNLYYANNNSLYRTVSASTVAAASWTNMTGTGTAVNVANQISALATTRGTYSAGTASLFIGTTNSKIYRLDDPANAAAGTAPVDISGAGFPASAYISSIAVNPRHDDTVLVTFSNYGVTSVFWTGNANSATPTWQNVEGNLTLPSFRSSAIVIKNFVAEYYVGTSSGLYGTTIDGASPGTTSWAQEGASDMGNAVVTSLSLRTADNKLLIGTHGYGMWSSVISNPLPITLLDFNGKLQGNDVALEWSTSAEYNSKEFQIEKSVDGINYSPLGTINAAGTSTVLKSYNYIDRSATEINYYRLKLVDKDGLAKQSNVVVVKNQGLKQGITILNNPFANQINIRFAKMPKGKVVLRLIDISGKQIAVNENYQASSAILSFDNFNQNLSRGIYILQAETEGKIYSAKLMKQ